MRRWLGLCCLLIGGIGGSVGAGAQGVEQETLAAGRGPIPLRDMRPYNLLFLQFLPETPDTLRLHANRYGLQLDIANNLLIPPPAEGAIVVEDNEVQRLTFSWRRGLGNATELGVFVPILWRNGGFLDALISAYHHLVGIAANAQDDPLGRDHWPKFRSLLQVVDGNGQVRIDQGNGFGLGETSITLKHSLSPSTPRSALAVRLGLKLPTGSPTLLLGSGHIDVGLSLDARYGLGRDVTLYGQFAGIAMGPAPHAPGARPSMWQAMAGIEYHPNRRDAFVLQVDGNSLALRTGNRFADRGDVTATFGYRRRLDAHHALFVSYSENGDIHNYTLPGFSNIGPDIAFSAGFEWR